MSRMSLINILYARQVVKLILLVAPVFLFVVAGAVWVMVGGSGSRIFDSNLKKN